MTNIEFQLLGSVGLAFDSKVVRLSSARGRSLLALLAWQPNEFVADEILIERIWDDAMPHDPRDSLYTCARRLRQTLGKYSRADSVVRRRGGYLLAVHPESVDLHRFRHFVNQAQDAAHRGDDNGAAELFRRAMRLWAGIPFAEVESSWARRTREMLGRELLTARLVSAEVGLRLGRHVQLIPALSQLVADDPFNEMANGLLMLALYRGGRRSEALAAYARIRLRLVEEFGMEPGRPLGELHNLILHGDPSLDPWQVTPPGGPLMARRRIVNAFMTDS